MSRTRYYLPEDTYLCMADDHVVILDLRRDKYLALDAGASSILSPQLGLLTSQKGIAECDSESRLGSVVTRLAADGILCTAPAPHASREIHRELTCPEFAIAPSTSFREHIGAGHAARYIASVMSAKSALRMRRLHRIVLSERRQNLARARSRQPFDIARAAGLCAAYARLRVIATGPKQCLFDSLALKRFLAKYDLFPEWIFGVRLNPFAAHCWLQHSNTLLNDSLDSVRCFTPIMAV
jgi:transglutaminase superfamily protein